MSELLAIGTSYKTAPVEIRERLALPDARAHEFVRDLRGSADVQEAVAISTCNRSELYLVVFAIVLIYVAIMAAKLSRIEREVDSIHDLLDKSGR